MGETNRHKQRCRNEQPDTTMMNAYQVLQLRHDATRSEIRDNYRRLALWYHPGRRKARDLSPGELQQCYAVFAILAASYETLMNHSNRQIYDSMLLQNVQAVWLAGKSALPSACSNLPYTDADDEPDLVLTQCSNHGFDGEFSPTMFLLIKARGGSPFTDPYQVFEAVFGSCPFERVVSADNAVDVVGFVNLRPSCARAESIRILPNGSIQSKTSRIQGGRKLIRTEVIAQSEGGQRHVFVNVAEEDIDTLVIETQLCPCFPVTWAKSFDDSGGCFIFCGNSSPGCKAIT